MVYTFYQKIYTILNIKFYLFNLIKIAIANKIKRTPITIIKIFKIVDSSKLDSGNEFVTVADVVFVVVLVVFCVVEEVLKLDVFVLFVLEVELLSSEFILLFVPEFVFVAFVLDEVFSEDEFVSLFVTSSVKSSDKFKSTA